MDQASIDTATLIAAYLLLRRASNHLRSLDSSGRELLETTRHDIVNAMTTPQWELACTTYNLMAEHGKTTAYYANEGGNK